uniref:Uncharacterized protein n=1 Tax=Cacopsylla melanoneura TaxID=428564 RepID=A0A8D9A9A1_9HEMI
MGYLCNGVLVILLVLVISDHNLVSSLELVDSSSNEDTGATQGQLDSPTCPISKETPSVLIIEKPQHDLKNDTLHNKAQDQNETKSPPEFFPFTKLVLKPVFHIKRVSNINDKYDNTETNNEVPRFVSCNNVPHFLDISGRRTPARPLIHRSIFFTKLINPRSNAMPRPIHYLGGLNPISSDPTLGLLDRMMNDLMVPLLNDMPLLDNVNLRRQENGEDSSLKFWMQNENRNKPNPWSKRENPFEVTDENVSSEDVGTNNDSTAEEDSDYKSDLWKKFMKDDKNKQDGIATDYATLDPKQKICKNCKSFEKSAEHWDGKMNDEKEAETEWWSRLVLPWKRPIYKDHKKSSHQETRMSGGDEDILDDLFSDEDEKESAPGFNTNAVGLRGNEELPMKYKMNLTKKHSKPMEGDSHTPTRGKRTHRNVNYDAVMVLFSFGIIIVLMYKIMGFLSKIRAHNTATTTRSPFASTERKLRLPPLPFLLPSTYYTPSSRQDHNNPVPLALN